MFLSEYLGNQAHTAMDVTEETASYKPPHPETWRQFEQRIRQHTQGIIDDDRIIWCITHGTAISCITKFIGPKYIRNVEPLDCIHVQNGRALKLDTN